MKLAIVLGLAGGAAAQQTCDITDSLPDLLFISDNVIMGDIDSAAPYRDQCVGAPNSGSVALTDAVELPAGSPFLMVSDAPDEMEMECFKPAMDWGGNCGECGSYAPMMRIVSGSDSWSGPGWFSGPFIVRARPHPTRAAPHPTRLHIRTFPTNPLPGHCAILARPAHSGLFPPPRLFPPPHP